MKYTQVSYGLARNVSGTLGNGFTPNTENESQPFQSTSDHHSHQSRNRIPIRNNCTGMSMRRTQYRQVGSWGISASTSD